MKTNLILAAISLVFFTACSTLQYGNDVRNSFARVNSTPCNGQVTRVSIFLEGEKVDFKYNTIGTVECIGNQMANSDKLFEKMRYDAWTNCGNAIINVKTTFVSRETGSLGSDVKSSYMAKVVTGTVVHIAAADMPTHIPTSVDTSFVTQHRLDQAQATKDLETETAVGVLTGIATLVVAGILSTNN